jgi:predicted AlkP superfamily phosphohydrolase/phosphomutase
VNPGSPPDRRRVVVVGFDAMDAGITRRMVEAGRLPTLASLLEGGSSGALRVPPGLVVGAIWPSLWSGVGPGTHGFYCFLQLQTGTYLIRRFTPLDITCPPYWEALAAAGRRVCLVDVPLVRPSAPVDGVHIVDWGTHDRMLAPTIWPTAVTETTARVGAHAIEGKCDDYAARGDFDGLFAALGRGIDQRTDLSLELLAADDWDLFMTVFSESHCAGHHFWPGHDPRHPHHAQFPEDGIELLYERLDAALARLVDALAPGTTVVVVQSHGFGQHHDGDHLIAEILRRLDDAYGAPPRWLVARERVARRWERASAHRRGLVPGGTEVVSVDSSRRVFKVPNNELFAGIRLNLRGREPRGRLMPGPERDAFVDWLEGELLALRCPDTARPLVRRVLRTADLYSGPRVDALPDLLVDWERSAPITGATSPTIGVVRGEYTGIRTGDHRGNGQVVVRGPGVPVATLGEIDVADVAPTIAALLGVELPAVDGHALSQLGV